MADAPGCPSCYEDNRGAILPPGILITDDKGNQYKVPAPFRAMVDQDSVTIYGDGGAKYDLLLNDLGSYNTILQLIQAVCACMSPATPGGGGGITGQDEGVNTGAAGSVNTINFVGAAVSAVQSGSTLNVGVNALVIKPPFINDGAAATGGVAIGEWYELHIDNTYGMTEGLAKRRKA